MLNVRQMRESDIPNMEKICLATANLSFKNTYTRREETLYLYNRYYTRAEQKNCFVAVDETDRAVGYILCAVDFNTYIKGFFKNELRLIFNLGTKKGIESAAETLSQVVFSKAYPAHMHIDILPDYQGGGTGTRLIHTLFEHLKSQNVSGLMLGAGSDNLRAIAFYKKNGFKELFSGFGATVMGIKF